MNELLCQTERREAPPDFQPGGRLFGRSNDHLSTPCQVILSLSTETTILLQRKHAGRGVPKEVPSGPVWVDRSGIATGHVVKHAPAFGPDRAVYAYPALHYPKWRIEFPSLTHDFHAGAFGEGFTLTGMDEETAYIGDLVRVGSCHLQLSEPGHPDEWLYARPRKNIVDAAKRGNRTGWYYRIIEPGWVTAGDSVVLLKRPNPSWSVDRFSQILGAADPTRKDLAELSTLKGLATDWQWAARKALKGVEQSLELFWGVKDLRTVPSHSLRS
jgi:MOSC domain-containing protein YiiM